MQRDNLHSVGHLLHPRSVSCQKNSEKCFHVGEGCLAYGLGAIRTPTISALAREEFRPGVLLCEVPAHLMCQARCFFHLRCN